MVQRTIVSVEDEQEISELIDAIIESPHINMVRTLRGVEGLETIRALRPDLVILDVMLPDMSGWAVYDAIRSDVELQNTPIIVLTVVNRAFRRIRAIDEDPLSIHMAKPFDARDLRACVEEQLGLPLWSAPRQTADDDT